MCFQEEIVRMDHHDFVTSTLCVYIQIKATVYNIKPNTVETI